MLRKIRNVLFVAVAVMGAVTSASAVTITLYPPGTWGNLITDHKTRFRAAGGRCTVSQSLSTTSRIMSLHSHTEFCRGQVTTLLQKKQSRWNSFGTVGVWNGNNSQINGSRKCYNSDRSVEWRMMTRARVNGRTSGWLPTYSSYARCK